MRFPSRWWHLLVLAGGGFVAGNIILWFVEGR
jgi:hypothetical protein